MFPLKSRLELPTRWQVRKFAGLVACAASLSGCEKTGDKTPATAVPPDVEFIEARQADVSITNEWIGTTDGFVNAEIKARVSGYLQSQNYTDGALVKAGDLLFQIDPRPFEATLAQAKAQLAKAVADKQKSQVDVDRLTPLVAQKAVAQQDLDDAVAANAANAAMIESANAQITRAQLDLDFTKVIAPIDGVVGIAQAQVGDLVGPASGPLASISTLDPIKVNFPISEQEYMRVSKKGEEEAAKPLEQRRDVFTLYLADGTKFPNKGKFYSVGLQVSVGTGTIPVVGIFPNPGNVLRPGQYARVEAVVREEKNAILVPQRAVNELQGVMQVVVIGADNKAEIRSVKVGDRVGSNWVITEGIQHGERVVVEGLQKVRNGTIVNPKPAPAQGGAAATASSPSVDSPKAGN